MALRLEVTLACLFQKAWACLEVEAKLWRNPEATSEVEEQRQALAYSAAAE